MINILNKDTECPVCYENIRDKYTTECKHVFCKNCIKKICEINSKCPLCQQEITYNNSMSKFAIFITTYMKWFMFDMYHFLIIIFGIITILLTEHQGRIPDLIIIYCSYACVLLALYGLLVCELFNHNIHYIDKFINWIKLIRLINFIDFIISLFWLNMLLSANVMLMMKIYSITIISLHISLFVFNFVLSCYCCLKN